MSTLCLADTRCRDYDHARKQPCEVWDTPLCAEDLRAGERAAQLLVLDYRDLEQFLPQFPAQRLDGQPGHSPEAPIPLRLDIEALQRAIWWVTTTWAEILADREHLSHLSKRVRDGWAVNWACGIIEPRITALAQIPTQELADYPLTTEDDALRHRGLALVDASGAEGVLHLMWLHDRARSLLGLTKRVRKLPGHCQQRKCGRAELTQEEGSDTVRCGHCGHAMTYDDYERYGNVFLQGAA